MTHPLSHHSRVHVYIDETGDRGLGESASPIFGMAAVIVDDGAAQELRNVVLQLRADFKVPMGEVLSWKNYVKTHDRRRHAAQALAAVEGLHVCYVYVDKGALRPGAYGGSVQTMYNYVAGKLLKNALWAARNAFGASSDVWVRYGHVRGHDHRTTDQYLRQRILPESRVPDDMLRGLTWVSADRYSESQAADLFGGFLKSALWPSGEFELVEPAYLLTVWSRIRNSDQCAIPLGLMSMPESGLITTQPWFPCSRCPKSGGKTTLGP